MPSRPRDRNRGAPKPNISVVESEAALLYEELIIQLISWCVFPAYKATAPSSGMHARKGACGEDDLPPRL